MHFSIIQEMKLGIWKKLLWGWRDSTMSKVFALKAVNWVQKIPETHQEWFLSLDPEVNSRYRKWGKGREEKGSKGKGEGKKEKKKMNNKGYIWQHWGLPGEEACGIKNNRSLGFI